MASETYSRHLIRIARRQSGLTQKMLAERAGTSQAAVSAYESARRSPSVDTLCRLLGAAGYEVRMRLAPADTHGPSSQPPRRCCRPINSEYSENVNESDWSDNESMPDLDVAAIVRTLNRHHVKYVIIGGIAAQIHGLPIPATVDIDVTPARDHRLYAARQGLRRNRSGSLRIRGGGHLVPTRPG